MTIKEEFDEARIKKFGYIAVDTWRIEALWAAKWMAERLASEPGMTSDRIRQLAKGLE